MSARGFRSPLLAVALAALVSACAVGPNYHPPQIALPDHYAAEAPSAPHPPATNAIELAAWWRALQDPELNSLIERAIAANPDVEIALYRLQEARTYEAGMLGEVLPDL